MGIPTFPVPRFPIDPAQSATEMQKLSDAVEQLQRTVSDNFSPMAVRRGQASLPVVVKISGNKVTGTDGSGNSTSVTLGKRWYAGKMQVPPTALSTNPFDPATDLDLSKLYSNKGSGSDDCYVMVPGTGSVPPDSYIFGDFQGLAVPSDGSLPVRPVILAGIPAGLFVVSLTQTGGSNGTQSTAASWTYTAKSLDGNITYGTTLSPKRTRANGTATAATLGTGYFDNTLAFQLYEALEYPGTDHC